MAEAAEQHSCTGQEMIHERIEKVEQHQAGINHEGAFLAPPEGATCVMCDLWQLSSFTPLQHCQPQHNQLISFDNSPVKENPKEKKAPQHSCSSYYLSKLFAMFGLYPPTRLYSEHVPVIVAAKSQVDCCQVLLTCPFPIHFETLDLQKYSSHVLNSTSAFFYIFSQMVCELFIFFQGNFLI